MVSCGVMSILKAASNHFVTGHSRGGSPLGSHLDSILSAGILHIVYINSSLQSYIPAKEYFILST